MHSLSWKSSSSFHKPRTIVKPRMVPKALPPIDWNTVSYLTGKGIIIFTFTYCTLNWLTLKQINDEDKDS